MPLGRHWRVLQVSSSESARLARAAAGTFNIRHTGRRCCNSRRNVNINWLQDNKAAQQRQALGAAFMWPTINCANKRQSYAQTPIHTQTYSTHTVTHRGSLSARWPGFYLIALRWQFLIAHRIWKCKQASSKLRPNSQLIHANYTTNKAFD